MTNLFTKDQLLSFNEIMLGRGMPVTDDGIGYNKADFGACATYFYGLSDAQLADLAKRLVKYCNTQLGVSKEDMKETAKALAEIADPKDRDYGISLEITENGTLISFRYNETFIETIKKQPRRKWDSENKNWVVPNDRLIPCLNELRTVGADVKNALVYAMSHPLIKDVVAKKTEVLTKVNGEYALLKFKYDQEIVNEIKQIDFKQRKWNAEHKYWAVKLEAFQTLQDKLQLIAEFKAI